MSKETDTLSNILAFITGEKADRELVEEISQKQALWQIRDHLEAQKKVLQPSYAVEVYHHDATVNVGWTFFANILTPNPDRQIGLVAYIVSFKQEGSFKFQRVVAGTAEDLTGEWHFAERGGIAQTFAIPLGLGINNILNYAANPEAAGCDFSVTIYAILNMRAEE